jgi:hypothetical protein
VLASLSLSLSLLESSLMYFEMAGNFGPRTFALSQSGQA